MTQLPSPQRSSTVPVYAKRLRPKTYSVAVYLVVLVVVLQIGMLISVFWLRAMVVRVSTKSPKPRGAQTVVAQTNNNNPAHTPPKPDVPNLPSLPALDINKHGSARLAVPKASDDRQQINNLNDEAQMFIKQHAYQSAIETLTKAEDIDPRYPDTLKNLAETYTQMADPAQAKIYWQRLFDLGPGADKIYANAQDHLALLGESSANILKDPSSHPRLIYVDSVEKTPVETTDGRAQFHLRATLMRKDPIAPFDQKKLQPYVVFYQQMSNGALVPDLGQRKGAFDDTFLFWNKKMSEPFGVDYIMPIPSAQKPDSAPIGNYYGFVIGIYYDKVLQDARSEPSDLVTRIPLPDEIE